MQNQSNAENIEYILFIPFVWCILREHMVPCVLTLRRKRCKPNVRITLRRKRRTPNVSITSRRKRRTPNVYTYIYALLYDVSDIRIALRRKRRL